MQVAKSAKPDFEFTFIDLRSHWNEPLLKRFYNEFLVPNFGIIPDELDPLETWIEALQDPNPEDIVAHVIIAFETPHSQPHSEPKNPQGMPANARVPNSPTLPPRPPSNPTNLQKAVQRRRPPNDLLVKNPTVSTELLPADPESTSEVSPSLPFSSETLSLTPMHEFEHCEQCEREAESSALLTTNATTGVEFSGRSRIPPRPPLPHRHYQQQQYAPRGPLRMVGGCCFEYCIASNSILLSYFCVDPHMRGKGLARRLADAAERIADNDARRFRRVPRCDAFYLETNKLSVAVKHRDVMNPRTRHQILYNIGFRALNFRFVQPPLSPQSQSFDGLWLCVRISSPHIVTQQQKEQLERELAATLEPPSATVVSRTLPPPPPQQDGTLVGSGGGGGYGASNAPAKRLFMPASFVKKFVIDYWMSCVSSWKTDVHLSTEKELRQMTEEISAKPFIELLELPWDASNPAVAMAMTDRPLLLPPVPSHSLSSHLPQSHSHSHGTVLLHPPLPPSLPSSHLLAKL